MARKTRASSRSDLQGLVIDWALAAGLTDAEAWLAGKIAMEDHAWTTRAAPCMLPDVVAELEAGGVIEPWDESPDGPAVTFTPYGAALFRVAIVEQWEQGEGTIPETGETYTGLIETPLWEDAGRASHRPPLELPKYAREVPLESPELIADDSPGPEYLIDEVSGEPIKLFGRPIPIDRRIRRGKAG